MHIWMTFPGSSLDSECWDTVYIWYNINLPSILTTLMSLLFFPNYPKPPKHLSPIFPPIVQASYRPNLALVPSATGLPLQGRASSNGSFRQRHRPSRCIRLPCLPFTPRRRAPETAGENRAPGNGCCTDTFCQRWHIYLYIDRPWK